MYAGNPYPRFLSPPPLATGLALVACLPLLHSFERQMNVCRQLLPKGFKPPPPGHRAGPDSMPAPPPHGLRMARAQQPAAPVARRPPAARPARRIHSAAQTAHPTPSLGNVSIQDEVSELWGSNHVTDKL